MAGPASIRAGVMLSAVNLPGKKDVIKLKYGAFMAENAMLRAAGRTGWVSL